MEVNFSTRPRRRHVGYQLLMNNPYYYHLKLPVKFSTSFVDDYLTFHTAFDINLINVEFRNWLADRGSCITGYCERFFLDPQNTTNLPIHIDNPDSTDHVKINYVYCDEQHATTWYRLKEGKKLNFSKTSIGTNYAWANAEDCEPVFSANVGQPGMFNATVLHSVAPVSTKRITFSMTLAKSSNNKLISWNEAEVIFKDYLC